MAFSLATRAKAKLRLKPVSEQVMVITGASSGIGRATAQAAAACGAKVVLASRSGDSLAQIEQEIARAGGRATHVVADVGREEEIRRVADTAMELYGGFDTWVNNAGVSIYGRLEESSDADNRRLFDTNFWGVVYGSLAAARHLRHKGGAIINIGSVASELAFPFLGMYSATKHAVKGFTDALRMELEQEGAPISVTLIKPAGINTPFPHHGKNYANKEPKLPPPVYQPDEVAHAILCASAYPHRDVFVGGGGRMMSSLVRLAPRTTDWYRERVVARQEFRDEAPRNPEGALHRASHGGNIYGDQPGYVMKSSLYTRAILRPVLSGLVLAAAAVAASAWIAGRGPGKQPC